MTTLTLPSAVRTGTLPAPGVYRNIPDEEYRSWPAVSQSDLKTVLTSPRHLKLSLDGKYRKESTGFSVGTLVHTQLLEPDRFASDVVVAEQRRTKKYLEENQGKILVTQTEMDDARYTADAINSVIGDVIQRALAAGDTELSMHWIDRESGLPCKGRLDIWDAHTKSIIDLKTVGRSARPDEFAKDCANYGYEIQARFYKRGLSTCGPGALRFLFLAAETSYPNFCGLYELGTDTERVAAQRIRRAMSTIAQCIKTNSWPGYNERDGQADTIDLPGWALR